MAVDSMAADSMAADSMAVDTVVSSIATFFVAHSFSWDTRHHCLCVELELPRRRAELP